MLFLRFASMKYAQIQERISLAFVDYICVVYDLY